jgi:hypothetical protein
MSSTSENKAEPRRTPGTGEPNNGANFGLAPGRTRDGSCGRGSGQPTSPPEKLSPEFSSKPGRERQNSSSRSPSANPAGHWKRS